MKYITLLLFVVSSWMSSCQEKRPLDTKSRETAMDTLVEIPEQFVTKDSLFYDNKQSLWMLGEQLYSGYALIYYPDSTLKEKSGFYKGKKQGLFQRWHPDGRLQQIANYQHGKLHRAKQIWSSDSSHTLLAHLNYQKGKVHGEQRKWYPSGELYKVLNLNMGKEEGIQRAYRKNGDLYANYEAKNGRIFGLKKAALCYGLEDETINYEE